MTKRSDCHGDALIGHRDKRCKCAVKDGPSQELISEQETINTTTMMPDAVYSLIWSFLLEPASQASRHGGRYVCSLDMKSISSFMLVNQRAKEEFDTFNGWRLVARAFHRESIQRHEHTNTFLTLLADIAGSVRDILERHRAPVDANNDRILLD